MGIDFEQKKVIVVQGSGAFRWISTYDELVIALGTSVDLKRFPGLPEHALTMKNLADAHRLRHPCDQLPGNGRRRHGKP